MEPYYGPLPVEVFDAIPRRVGWWYSHNGQTAFIAPAPVFATAAKDLRPVPWATALSIVPLQPEDERRLLALFLECLRLADYSSAPFGDPDEEARQHLRRYFGDPSRPPLECSGVALDGARPVGAALLSQGNVGPILAYLFVDPHYRRSGLATALVGRAIELLLTEGAVQLFSRYWVGNEASIAWHQRQGFRELPDLGVAGHRAEVHEAELQRRRRLGDATADELAALAGLASHSRTEFERLLALAGPDPWCPRDEVVAAAVL